MTTEPLITGSERSLAREEISASWTRILEKLGYVIVALAAFWGFWIAYQECIALRRLPSSDEAMYYLWGLQIWRDLSLHQWHPFLLDTYHQQIIPFLGSHLFALGMFVGRPSVDAVRVTNLITGTVAVVALAAMSAALARRERALAAGMTAAVWGSSTMHLAVSSQALLDPLALLLTAVSILSAVKFAERPSRSWAVVCGFSAALCFLTKYNIGVFLVFAVVLGLGLPRLREEFIERRTALLRAVTHPWTLLALSMTAPIGLWLSLSGVRMVLAYARGYAFPPLGIAENLLYYPRSLFEVYFSHGALALLPIAGFLYWAVACWTDRRGRVAWLYVAIYFVVSTVHTQKDARVVIIPAAVAVALGAAALASEIGKLKQTARVALHAAALLIGIAALLAGPRALREQWGASSPRYFPAQESVVRSALEFYRQNARAGHPLAFVGSGGLTLHIVRVWMSDPSVPRIARVDELPYPGFQEFRGWGFSTEPSPRYTDLLQAYVREAPDADMLVAKYSADSPLKSELYPFLMAWQEHYVSALETLGGWYVVAEKRLPMGLTVRIYRRAQASQPQTLEAPR